MQNDVQQRILKVICEVLDRKESEVRLETSIRDDLQASSLDRLTLFVALEDEFQRTIPPEEVIGLDTVKDIVDFVINKVLQEPSPA